MCCICSSISAYIGYEYILGNLGGDPAERAKKLELRKKIDDAVFLEDCDEELYEQTKDKTYKDLSLPDDFELVFNQFNEFCKFYKYKELGALSDTEWNNWVKKWRKKNPY